MSNKTFRDTKTEWLHAAEAATDMGAEDRERMTPGDAALLGFCVVMAIAGVALVAWGLATLGSLVP